MVRDTLTGILELYSNLIGRARNFVIGVASLDRGNPSLDSPALVT